MRVFGRRWKIALLAQKSGFGLVVHLCTFRPLAARCKLLMSSCTCIHPPFSARRIEEVKRFGEMKVGTMARIALPIIFTSVMANAALAQDALPETPPELRDFRLDPERPAPQPTPQPEIQPPPVAQTVDPQPEPAAPRARPSTASPTRSPDRSVPDEDRSATGEAEPTAAELAVEPSIEIDAPPLQKTAPVAEAPASAAAPSAVAWWQIAAALLTALGLLGGWLFLRKRRKLDSAKPDLAIAEPLAPQPLAVPAPQVAPPIVEYARRPRLSLEFVPDKATLGFSALTLKGQLRLVNDGDAPARDMQLRATMISASQRQQETIAAFHGGAIPITPNPLGEAKAGEQLALDIEMSVQVSELDSYMIGDKKIFVPVMLANLSYDWEGGSDNVTMAWMVGRESAPQQPKMGPLRLDLGPRSFSPLGQRPIYA